MRYLRGPFRRHRAGHRASEIQVMLRRTARVLIFSSKQAHGLISPIDALRGSTEHHFLFW
jgi:hypothetical protein